MVFIMGMTRREWNLDLPEKETDIVHMPGSLGSAPQGGFSH
jgi:hypothetical protein